MPQLYVMPGTCALAPNIAAAWLDAPVEIVAMAYGDHRKPDYLAINPRGLFLSPRVMSPPLSLEWRRNAAKVRRHARPRAHPSPF